MSISDFGKTDICVAQEFKTYTIIVFYTNCTYCITLSYNMMFYYFREK